MRTAFFAALLLLILPDLHAQIRRHPALIQDQNLLVGTGFPDSSINPPVPSDAAVTPLAPGGAISVSELRIPAKARKEFERSEKAYRAGDLRASTDHLQKAVQIYPDFAQAHTVLGIRYAGLGKLEESLAEYRQALTIDPNSGEASHNLAVILFSMNRFEEAEEPARRAMELLPQEAATRYVLGCILIRRNKATPEAIQFLSTTADKFPNAHLVLAQVAFKQGRVDEALTRLRAYLSAPQADNKAKVECWVAELTHAPSSSCGNANSASNLQ